ncbi:hypothetical protein B7494_g467 [Chlorociboria aeruginascens]|nr:hypothetical protein B7494_g467 [Chlorociboria aeruginascens]
MASIFTYGTDPPRVSSPWLTPVDSSKPPSTPQSNGPSAIPTPMTPAEYGVTRLEAEPQEGPIEYKLHLLLRARRAYSSSSTGSVVSGSQQHKQQPPNQPIPLDPSSLASSERSQQKRLEQLTTQLLWRLQQSSPYHASSPGDLVLPKIPEASVGLVDSPSRPSKLPAGLEESRGALYEIGVSDDGALIGLTKDELEESLKTLRAMASSLGCNVEVMRRVVVGDCEWYEPPDASEGFPKSKFRNKKASVQSLRHQAQLWVAEALITPDLSSRMASSNNIDNTTYQGSPKIVQIARLPEPKLSTTSKTTEQLRITLTGPTTSGKSSLLGTLSTATLDNGRGKSRLSLLKHRHEILSGVTSSLAQELIGYKSSDVINYSSGNVTSWTDIHASAENGRLVFVSDSAGHPRYRRTTVKGLIGWAPHWTILCIAADDGENAPSSAGGTSSAQDILGVAGTGIDLSKAHLELCLKIEKSLAIVITKLDLASKTSLRETVSKVLSAVKGVGRIPSILPPDQTKIVLESDLTTIPKNDLAAAQKILSLINDYDDLKAIVPIIMTSAAKGTGIRQMHALLQRLPVPATPTSQDFVGLALNPEQPACLFHIEDVFGLPASYESLASNGGEPADTGSVVAGHLRFGSLSVGSRIVVGPFPDSLNDNYSPTSQSGARFSPASFGVSLSHPSAIEPTRAASRNIVSASMTKGEWHNAHIVSIRNLRLPVHTLEAGQVGTIGFVFDLPKEVLYKSQTPPRIRKGMVIAIPSRHMDETGHTLQAASGFTASFEDGDINSITPGSLVVVYIASIRASARVIQLEHHGSDDDSIIIDNEDPEDVFGLTELSKVEEEPEPLVFGSDGITDVTLELMTNREWIELGSQVLVMPGGGHGLYHGSERGEKGIAGLDGYVGKVIQVVE